jgi:hypothetical protein
MSHSNLDPFSGIQPLTHYHQNGSEFSSVFAEKLHTCGTILTNPTSWWLDGAVRVFVLELNPGWQNQCSTTTKECCYRAALCVLGVITLPFALLFLVFGAPMRALASQFKADFIMQSPSTSTHDNSHTKKILSFNALLMPEFISRRNKCRSTMERVVEVGAAIIKKNTHVICLQEVFHTAASKILGEMLTKAGYYVIRNVGDQVFGLNSGLLMASKNKFENVKFYPHPFTDGADGLANKGILLATTKIGNKNVLVTNYHANGGGDKIPGYLCRFVQQEAATAHIERYILESPVKLDGEFFIGDTNVGPTETGERDKETHAQIAVSEPEWELIDYMDSCKELAAEQRIEFPGELPLKQDIRDKQKWVNSLYLKMVKEAFETLDSRQIKDLDSHLIDLCTQNKGGPVSTRLYKHDLHQNGVKRSVGNKSSWAASAKAGSTVDLGQHPDTGFRAGHVTTAPRRLDFIAVRKRENAPELVSVVVLPMFLDGGPLCSDHHGVVAEVRF